MGGSDTAVIRLVLDVLKPLDPSIVDMASEIAEVEGVDLVSVTSVEIDRNTESVKVSIEGNDVDLERVRRVIERMGGVIHSVDEVTSVKIGGKQGKAERR